MALLEQTKREIEIQSVDFDFTGLIQLATILSKKDRVITLVVGDNLTNSMVENIIRASNDHFNIKFA